MGVRLAMMLEYLGWKEAADLIVEGRCRLPLALELVDPARFAAGRTRRTNGSG